MFKVTSWYSSMPSFMVCKWPTQQEGIIRDNVKLEVLMVMAIKITVSGMYTTGYHIPENSNFH